jgi:hypothetical protein
VVGVLLLAALSVVGKDGRDFAGYFQLTDISENGDQVQVTLNLALVNESGVDLQQAVVVVRQSQPQAEVLGSSSPIESWRNGEEVKVAKRFTIGRKEYERWSTHGQPNVFVVYRGEDGQTWQRTAQLNRHAAMSF